MTGHAVYQPDPQTRAALQALRSWVTTEQLLDQLQRRLCPANDIGRAIADELGVTIDDWHGYHAIRHPPTATNTPAIRQPPTKERPSANLHDTPHPSRIT